MGSVRGYHRNQTERTTSVEINIKVQSNQQTAVVVKFNLYCKVSAFMESRPICYRCVVGHSDDMHAFLVFVKSNIIEHFAIKRRW